MNRSNVSLVTAGHGCRWRERAKSPGESVHGNEYMYPLPKYINHTFPQDPRDRWRWWMIYDMLMSMWGVQRRPVNPTGKNASAPFMIRRNALKQ